jgi:uncharacterized membrane protein YfcA
MNSFLIFSPETMVFYRPEVIASPFTLILLLFVGIGTGTISGILGIGGGLLIVPCLSLWNIPLVQATATSLLGVLLSAMSGSWRNWVKGELRWRQAIVLGLCGLPTAQIGAWVANQMNDRVLAFSIAVFLVAMIFLVEYKKRLGSLAPLGQEGTEPKRFDLQLIDSPNLLVPLTKGDLGGSVPIGLIAGFLAGLFGVGGGAVMVPLQMVWLGEPIKSAVRTSLGAIVLISMSGLWRYAIQGNVLWGPGIALAIGGAIGAQFGTRLLKKLSSDRVNQLFRALLIILSIYMTWRGIRGR